MTKHLGTHHGGSHLGAEIGAGDCGSLLLQRGYAAYTIGANIGFEGYVYAAMPDVVHN